MPNLRPCLVSFTDAQGLTHGVRVCGESLYEAAVLAMAEFRRDGFADAVFGPATQLCVAVESPATTHELSVAKITAWLEGGGRSPSEHALKARLRAILARR